MNSEKSILFILGRFAIGGVERVTVTMANVFANAGWRVCIVMFEIEKRDLLMPLDSRVSVYELGFPPFRILAIKRLRCIMQRQAVHFIVNQWALPFPVTVIITMAKPTRAKIIAFHHTMPNKNRRLSCAVGMKRLLFLLVSKISLRLVYHFSDAYVVLSPSLMPVFREFVGIKNTAKLTWLPNPLNYDAKPVEMCTKENAILYVGRLSCVEKRVDRVLNVWRQIAEDLPEWRLDIVGDGPDRVNLEAMAVGLPRVQFHGFQSVTPYYQRSKILLLTSDFEGFAVVLVEAMAYGCVPVAFGSYPTVNDIIHVEDGIVVPTPWDEKVFSQRVVSLAKDEIRRKSMEKKGKARAQAFGPEKVFAKYLELFNKLDSRLVY